MKSLNRWLHEILQKGATRIRIVTQKRTLPYFEALHGEAVFETRETDVLEIHEFRDIHLHQLPSKVGVLEISE
jgi:hypothetical protein